MLQNIKCEREIKYNMQTIKQTHYIIEEALPPNKRGNLCDYWHTHIFGNTNIFLLLLQINFKKNIKLKQILINFNHFKVNPFQFQKGHFLNIKPILPKQKTRQILPNKYSCYQSQLCQTKLCQDK